MATKDFRLAYYSTLGVQTVDAKSALNTIFSTSPISSSQLRALCVSVRIPRMFRRHVWRSVLGLAPARQSDWAFEVEHKRDEAAALRRAARVLLRPLLAGEAEDALTPDEMCRMLLVQDAKGVLRTKNYTRTPHLYAIADCILEVCDGYDDDAYFIFRAFVQQLNVSMSADSINKRHYEQCAALESLLKIHSPSLLDRLLSINVLLDSLAPIWYSSFFSLVLPAHCLEGIWDAVIAGSWDLLDYLGLSLLLASKRKIEGMKNAQEFATYCLQIEDFVNVDAVAVTAIDLWEKKRIEEVRLTGKISVT
ncbi:TBC1 domain member 7 [Rhizoclosmatium sp. JEL0117]|nr:TBC1 domain member 7 [Rhizoclosmatium sp. JEL0117]